MPAWLTRSPRINGSRRRRASPHPSPTELQSATAARHRPAAAGQKLGVHVETDSLPSGWWWALTARTAVISVGRVAFAGSFLMRNASRDIRAVSIALAWPDHAPGRPVPLVVTHRSKEV